MKVWTCYDGLFQQTWNFGSDGRLSLGNGESGYLLVRFY